MEIVKWGIIGCGDVTEVKSGPAFSNVADSELVAVMRRNGRLARDYARRHDVPKWYDAADSLISDPEVNAIYVATPPDTHAEYTIHAFEAGKPVYVEKPMARTGDECRRMINAAGAARLPLFVAFYRRRLPSFLHVKKLLEEGVIGDVRLVNVKLYAPAGSSEDEGDASNWRVIPDIAGGGYFVDLAAHQFDYLDYIFGPIVGATGVSLNQAGLYPAEDAVSASWHHESGVLGTGSWSFAVDPESALEETEIVGSRGRIRFSFFEEPSVILEVARETEVFTFENPPNIQEPLIETVVDALLGRGECPSTGESGARTTQVMETILASSERPRQR
ncbi:MAG: Gfo/Idh/MocA family oxidoreductase [Candidatus Latescibacterota bacterium]|jgi:predicted dehydrogenase